MIINRQREKKTPKIYDWLLAVTVLIVMLCIAELVLGMLSTEVFHVWPPGLHNEFEPVSEIMPGVSGTSVFTINDLGLRGRNKADDDAFNIVAIGGSTTECLYLDDREAWPQLLENTLNTAPNAVKTWVGNAGRSGHNTRNHRFQVMKLLKQDRGIDLLIMMVGVNDLALRLKRGAGFVPFEQETPRYQRKLFLKSFSVIPPMAGELPAYQRFALWQRIRWLHKRIAKARDLAEVETATGNIYVERRRMRAETRTIHKVLPPLATALDEYEQNIRAMIDQANGFGVRVVLLTQPAMWRAGLSLELARLLWLGEAGEDTQGAPNAYYSIAALAEGMDLYNQRLMRVCRDAGAICIDLASQLARDTSVFYDDVHFNENGARAVAALIARELILVGAITRVVRN